MSKKKNNRQGEIEMINENEIVNEEVKTLEDCTMEELIALACAENIIVADEVTKEELIELIRANHSGETEQEKPEGNDQEKPEGNDQVEPEGNNDEETDEIVIGCVNPARLNVREEASKTAKIVTVITKDSEVEINLSESTEDFYRVININGEPTLGYCVKEFITIK